MLRNFPFQSGRLPALLALSLFLTGCHQDPKPTDPNFVMARTKDGFEVTRAMVDEVRSKIPKEDSKSPSSPGAPAAAIPDSQLVDSLITEHVLLAEYDRKHLPDVTPELEKKLADIHTRAGSDEAFTEKLKSVGMTPEVFRELMAKQLKAAAALEALNPAPGEPTPAEIEAYYRANLSSLTIPEMRRVSQILARTEPGATPAQKIAAREQLAVARKKIEKGADFAKTSTTISDDRETASKGGDLGFLSAGQLPPALDAAVKGASPGFLSDIVEGPQGYYLLKVTEVRAPQPMTLVETTPLIATTLRRHSLMVAQFQSTQGLKTVLAQASPTYYFTRPADAENPPVVPGPPPPPPPSLVSPPTPDAPGHR